MLSRDRILEVKSKGFLLNRGTEEFSARIITKNGVLSSSDFKTIANASDLYGSGKITLTSRMTVEVVGIKDFNIENFILYLHKHGLEVGGTGKKVRPIVACKGTTCVFGLCDTQELAKEIHEKFYNKESGLNLPHKFKIGVGGCPNNCIKPELNDFGISARKIIKVEEDKCKACKKCSVVEKCPKNALVLDRGKIVFDKKECISCGRCVGSCPFKVIEKSESVYKVFLGGRWGREHRIPKALKGEYNKVQIFALLENSLNYYRQNGKMGERFGDMLDRVGLEKSENDIIESL